jgi:hypothetical protein
MQVYIDEIVASVKAVDGDAMLSPRVVESIVRAVLAAQEAANSRRETADGNRTIGIQPGRVGPRNA